MTNFTFEQVKEYVAKAREHDVCKGNIHAAERALEAGDIEECLAIARGNPDWVRRKFGITLKQLGDGPAKNYYTNDMLHFETTYKKGKIHGEYKKYYYTGQLEYIISYEKGKVHGYYVSYYTSGQVFIEGTCKNSKLHGMRKEYYSNGQLMRTCMYKNDKLLGTCKRYNRDGQLVQETK